MQIPLTTLFGLSRSVPLLSGAPLLSNEEEGFVLVGQMIKPQAGKGVQEDRSSSTANEHGMNNIYVFNSLAVERQEVRTSE